MAIPILIIGKSGSGKSTSMRNFAEDELALINVMNKPLPFKKEFKSTASSTDVDIIIKKITGTNKKVAVVDDAGYIITNHFMKNHSSNKQGNAIFSLYNDLGDMFWGLIEGIKEIPENDKIVYLFMHEDTNEFGDVKPKTIGKLLDEKVCLEGLFTIVLRAAIREGKHVFLTHSDGSDPVKTPIGMFEEEEIPNDLKAVDTTIREYYGLNTKGEK